MVPSGGAQRLRVARGRRDLAATGARDPLHRRPYFASAACVVAPLRAGGGTRLKILDAWAMERPVVSTWIGAEGLLARDGENILLRDDAEGFAAAVAEVVADPSIGSRLGRAARRTVETVYAWEVIGGPMIEAYRGVLAPTEAPLMAVG